MKVKTSTLIGPALDWAVEVAKGTHWSDNGYFIFDNPRRYDSNPEWRYTTEWAQAGPIIEREEIALTYGHIEAHCGACMRAGDGFVDGYGPAPLIAVMRCYVASKLGDEVDIPDGLV